MSEYFRVNNFETDFATATTFSRSGTATKINSSGLLVEVADGVAREDAWYYNSSGVLTKGGLLLESAAATNLFEDSNDFSTGTNGAGTQNATGPDGTTSAWTFVDNDDDSSGATWDNNSVTVATETAYTASIFAKADQSDWIALGANGFTTPANSEAYFDLANGVIGTVDAGLDDARMEYYGNGWWRCSITFTTDVSDTAGFIRYFICPSDGTTSITRDGTNSLLMYGRQLETGPIATSYIPTSGSTVTRAAETLSVAGADTPANTTAISISMKGLVTYTDNNSASEKTFLRWYGDASNRFLWYLYTNGGTGGPYTIQVAAGTSDIVLGGGSSIAAGVNSPFNIAARHTSGALNVAINGTAATANTTPTALADLSSTTLQVGQNFGGFISEFRMWGTDIGDSGIAEVTS